MRESEEVGVVGVGVGVVTEMDPVAPEAEGVFVVVEGGGAVVVVGGVMTGALCVEPLAPVDWAEVFPAAS